MAWDGLGVRSLALKGSQTRGWVRGQTDHAAQTCKIKRFANKWKDTRDHKSAAGFLHDRIVNGHDKRQAQRPYGRNFPEIRQHSIAFEHLNMLDFATHVFLIRAGDKTSFAADHAHPIALLNFYDHGATMILISASANFVQTPPDHEWISGFPR